MQEYNICYSLDSAYAEQLAVSVASILKNADVDDNINFYILDGGLTQKDKTEIESLKNIKTFNIEYISIDNRDFSNLPLLKEKDDSHKDYHVTLPTYYRFKLSEFFPTLEKILYFDCDVIVRTSLKELYNIDLKDFAAAMALDAESEKEAQRLKLKNYYNAGVMLINLEYWRKHNVEQRLFDFAAKNPDIILWQDQDIINSVLAEKIKKLDNLWNYQYFLYENIDNNILGSCHIFHLAGRFKPWLLPFEHTIYEYYYYYLSFTPWKNRIIEYRQKASGKRLKNNIGGSTTNILVNVTDEDLQKVYDEINSNYTYTNKQIDLAKKEYDVKITNIYDEIAKTYAFAEHTAEKIKINIENETNKKIDDVYTEITKNYEFTKDKFNEVIYNSEKDTDSKIELVYDEITRNYEYTNSLSEKSDIKTEELKSFFLQNISENSVKINTVTDEKISHVYEEITKNYEYTNSLSEKFELKTEDLKSFLLQNISENAIKINADTDKKISNVYGEITKNYKYTDELIVEANKKADILDSGLNEVKSSLDKINDEILLKIADVSDEISRNAQYTDFLVKSVEEKQNQARKDSLNEINNNINVLKTESNEKLNKSVNDLYISMDEKIRILDEVFGEKIDDVSYQINKETNLKFSELYSYTNEQTSRLFKELKDSGIKIENNLNSKIYDLYKNNEILKDDIKSIIKHIEEKTDKNESIALIEQLKQELKSYDSEYHLKLLELQNNFEEKLNAQRIKYENKLINMENKLEQMESYMRKSIFAKLVEKLRKAKKR